MVTASDRVTNIAKTIERIAAATKEAGETTLRVKTASTAAVMGA
jgi:hypothetical protein